MLLTWNGSENNGCENKTLWLIKTGMSKSFFLFHITYIGDIKGFFKGLSFRSTLVLS